MSAEISDNQTIYLHRESIQKTTQTHPQEPRKADQTDRPGSEQLLDLLHTIYHEGFINFDKNTYEILRIYIDACVTVFNALLNPSDRTFSMQVQLLALSLLFGIDWALTALKNKDKLLSHFHYTPEDFYHTKTYEILPWRTTLNSKNSL